MLALRDCRDRRTAAGIDLFGADHARRVAGRAFAADAELRLRLPRPGVVEIGLGHRRFRQGRQHRVGGKVSIERKVMRQILAAIGLVAG